MPSSKSTPKKKPSHAPANKTSRSGELKETELDKVSGGLRKTFTGDPCDGGE
jgi:hypothetical protein